MRRVARRGLYASPSAPALASLPSLSGGYPASQVLISATPDGIYISVAEKPQGWQCYIRDGNSQVCPGDRSLDVCDMLTVREYGPFELDNEVHLKTFGFITAALLTSRLEKWQGAG